MPDPTGALWLQVNYRYSGSLTEQPDKTDRVILVVRPTAYGRQ